MILLHGFGASLESWNDLVPFLQERYALYLIDLNGFGLSSKSPRDTFSVHEQADIINGFTHSLNLTDVILAGHSYGGAIAITAFLSAAAKTQASAYTALILIDSAGLPVKLPFFVSVLQNHFIASLVYCIPARWRASFTLHHLVFDDTVVTDERIDRYARYFDLPGAHSSFRAAARRIIPPDHALLISQLSTITVPTLIVWGKNDPAIPLDHAYKFSSYIPISKIFTLDDCGHIPHEELPLEVSNILLESGL